MTLAENTRAPALSATTHAGEALSLPTLNAAGKVAVVFFYPKNETAVCTAEACAFRDAYEDFSDAGAVVIGVSADGEDSHNAFAQNHRLPFHLVSDENGAIAKAWGVKKRALGMLPGRVTYVVNPDGKIVKAFESSFQAQAHVDEALETVRKLSTQ